MRDFEVIAEGKVERVCKDVVAKMVFVPIFIFPISDTDNYIYIRGERYEVDSFTVFPSLKDVKVGDVVKVIYNESRKTTFLGAASCENSKIYEAYRENKTLNNFIALFLILLSIVGVYHYELFFDVFDFLLDMGMFLGLFLVFGFLLFALFIVVIVSTVLAEVTLSLIKRFKKKKVGI